MDFLLQHQMMNSAAKYPEKDAVVFGNEKLTYAELDALTTKVAWQLKDCGVQRGDRVGIYVHKSISSIVSIYGILKAGAVYVPLDPSAPIKRHAYIVDNCQLNCVLTSTAKLGSTRELAENSESLRTAILTDSKAEVEEDMPIEVVEWNTVTARSEDTPPPNPSINTDLAYILYTSGSTGTPKGVMISHLNSLTFVNWAQEALGIEASDRMSNHAPLHFDLSILDIFVAARVGATLLPVPETMSLFPVRLANWIAENRISVWYSVPSILSMMVLHGKLDTHDFGNLRRVLYAGEVFPVKYLRELMNLIPTPEYFNLYGPTETNVITYYKTPVLPADQTKPVPIGITCENMEVFALTKDGDLVTEPGVEGELICRGSNVAQGYWADDEKTGKGFVDNHLQPNFRERMYHTGDLVTVDEDGQWIYLGRKDHMIKSRGYRIEIGEIESAIYSHESVKEAAVIAIPDELITNRIKAFIAMEQGVTMDASDMRMFISQKVPKYMVPEIIEFREELPKTSTGKVNKPDLLKESVAVEA